MVRKRDPMPMSNQASHQHINNACNARLLRPMIPPELIDQVSISRFPHHSVKNRCGNHDEAIHAYLHAFG